MEIQNERIAAPLQHGHQTLDVPIGLGIDDLAENDQDRVIARLHDLRETMLRHALVGYQVRLVEDTRLVIPATLGFPSSATSGFLSMRQEGVGQMARAIRKSRPGRLACGWVGTVAAWAQRDRA